MRKVLRNKNKGALLTNNVACDAHYGYVAISKPNS